MQDKDVRQFAQYFSNVDIQYFLFLKKLVRFPIISKFADQLDAIDFRIVDTFPFLKYFYFGFVLEFKK
jgi:hypothetical protein